MFIDHRHRLIFFHNPRCGGTTITRWAASLPHAAGIDLLWCTPSPEGRPDLGHLTPRQAHGRVEPTLLRHYHAFTVCRQPLSRLCSGFQELIRQPLGRRWLNRHAIASLADLARHLRRQPLDVHDETIPWIRPQAAYLDPRLHGFAPEQFTILSFETLEEQLPAFLAGRGYASWPSFRPPAAPPPRPAGLQLLLDQALQAAYGEDLSLLAVAGAPGPAAARRSVAASGPLGDRSSGVALPAPPAAAAPPLKATPAAADVLKAEAMPLLVIHRSGDIHRHRRLSAQAVERGLRLEFIEACTPEQLTGRERASLVDPLQACGHEGALAHAVLRSHLRALRCWLSGGAGEFALILEDDLDLAGFDAWGFTLAQLAEALPSNCGVLQLAVIWPLLFDPRGLPGQRLLPTPPDLRLHRHRPGCDWSTAALLWRRRHAEMVLERLEPDPQQGLDPEAIGGPLLSDALLFDHHGFGSGYAAYSSPLLTCHGFRLPEASAAAEATSAAALGALGSSFDRSALQQRSHDASRDWIRAQLQRQRPIPLEAVSNSGQPVWLETREQPLVSLCTPTRNRARLLPLLERCILDQTYPRCRLEWLIVDDSDADQEPFRPRQATGLRVRQHRLEQPLPIGAKRNLAADLCHGLIVINCDDDDFSPPQRVEHAVQALLGRPDVLVAGSSLLPIQFWDRGELWTSGPFAPGHATAGTLAYRRLMLAAHRHDPEATSGEEQSFLDGFRLPMVQLDAWSTSVLMAHRHNTIDKGTMLKQPAEHRMQRSDRTLAQLVSPDLLAAYAHWMGPGDEGTAVS